MDKIVGYLDQIIDNMAIFEINDGKDLRERLFVMFDKRCSYFIEGYYYNLTLSEEGDDRTPFLIYEDNEWAYANKDRNQKIRVIAYGINIEETQKARKEISEIGRDMRLRGAFFNELHIHIKQNNDGIDDWKINFDNKERYIYITDYEKYKKNTEESRLDRRAWENIFKESIEEIASKWQVSEKNLSVLNDSKISIYDISYFLNKHNPERFVLYRQDVFCLFKLLNCVKKSCRTSVLRKNIEAYKEYNDEIVSSVNKIYNNGLKSKEDWMRISYFFDKKFVLYRFLWNQCIFPN